jgi:peptidoglycan/xylan/chitin deacetylase (PgdA/CDA1 family)
MKSKLLILILFILSPPIFGQSNQVCFTFDDLPFVVSKAKSIESQNLATIKLLGSLIKHKIPAIGFVNEVKLYDGDRLDPRKLNLLKVWLQSGMELGNHTYSHKDFHSLSCREFFDDIIKGEKIIRPMVSQSGGKLKYFRHPFLHAGESKEKADSLHGFLKKSGYEEAPVTIDDSDWIFNLAYDSAMTTKDTIMMNRIGEDYIDYMEKKLKYFTHQSIELFGRNIKQILLLHANSLNADYLDRLADTFKKNNYKFVPLNHALRDDLYRTEVTVYKNWGISWLDRWALSKGKTSDFFKDEPLTPDYIMKLAKIEHE